MVILYCPPPIVMTITVIEPDGTIYEQTGTVAFKCRRGKTIADLVLSDRDGVVALYKDWKSMNRDRSKQKEPTP